MMYGLNNLRHSLRGLSITFGPFMNYFQKRFLKHQLIKGSLPEYCNDVKCPIQLLLNKQVDKSPEYEEIRAICASGCLHSTHEFHQWLIGKGYLIVRPEPK
jgi:hypothetical protein